MRKLITVSAAVLAGLLALTALPGCGVPDETLTAYEPAEPLVPSAILPDAAPAAEEQEQQDITPVDAENKVWNVKDFGASGNGRVDDYVAVQKAVNTVLRAGGGTVYFPEGSYRLSETLRITMEGEAPLTLMADPAASVTLVADGSIEGPAVYINHPYVTLSHIGVTDSASGDSVAIVLASDYAVLDTVPLKMGGANSAPAVLVYGSYNTLKHISMQWGPNTTYAVEFTKKPGTAAYGNVLEDSHFGGEWAKCVLVTTEDEGGVQENLTIRRNVFLVVACDQIELRAGKDIFITDNMLDAAGVCLLMRPVKAGITGVQMTDNYCGASTGGDRTGGIRTEDDLGGSITGVTVSANYFWCPNGISFVSDAYTDFELTDNYFVLTGGTAMYIKNASGSFIEGNMVVNLNSKDSLKIGKTDEKTVIQYNILGEGVDVPGWKDTYAALN